MSRAERERAARAPHQLAIETVSVTCCVDERAHEVRDTEFAAGLLRRDGYYRALCGHTIAAAPMAMPEGKPCPECAELRRPAQGRRRLARRRRLIG